MALHRRIKLALGGAICGAMLAVIGRDRLYLWMQRQGFLRPTIRGFVGDAELQQVVSNWQYAEDQRGNPGRSSGSLAMFSDASLAGYGLPKHSGDDHLPINQQLRAAVLPHLRDALANPHKTVVELGTGNGDLLAYCAAQYPDTQFIGVEFFTDGARRHSTPNLRWAEGYALDLLRVGQLRGDILLASSTLCYAGPIEIVNYAAEIRNAGFSTVIIRDAVTNGFDPERHRGQSLHIKGPVWGHDYRVIFGDAGYRTTAFSVEPFTGHRKAAVLYNQICRFDLIDRSLGNPTSRPY